MGLRPAAIFPNPQLTEESASRLFGMGLWNRFENRLNHRPGHDHALIDPLVRPLLDGEAPPQ